METKNLLVVHTGNGKGKTTAALGIVFRALGRGIKCGVIQFLKGKWETGERKFAATIPELDFHVMGLGFTWESDDLDQDKRAAKGAWEKSVEYINDDIHKIVVLDELTYAIHYGWLDIEEVVQVLKNRPADAHVVITGRDCPEAIIEIADMVSVTESPKHPFQKGIKAQKGIDF